MNTNSYNGFNDWNIGSISGSYNQLKNWYITIENLNSLSVINFANCLNMLGYCSSSGVYLYRLGVGSGNWDYETGVCSLPCGGWGAETYYVIFRNF
jgi:hypothetical protein